MISRIDSVLHVTYTNLLLMDNTKWVWDDRYDVPRDLIGYGPNPPHPKWPNNAKLAVSFVINYEEGGEYSVLNDDDHSEAYLCEAAGGKPKEQARNTNIESEYEYGSRAGIWRLLNVFRTAGFKGTVYGVGKALEANPQVAKTCVEMGWEMASHGWRWIDYHDMPVEKEREEIEKCVDVIEKQTGQPPRGWYVGRLSPRSLSLLVDSYNKRGIPLLWHSDNYGDDLPFWKKLPKDVRKEGGMEAVLTVPYSLDCNDFKYAMPNNWSSPDHLLNYLKGAFDELLKEGENGSPKMMSIGLHARLSGRPGRVGAVRKFVEYVRNTPGVWVATREEIAEHWRSVHPYNG
jgi:peptidoglycan/xylan/chitin deacetylase (PgdA/CDA1 family)